MATWKIYSKMRTIRWRWRRMRKYHSSNDNTRDNTRKISSYQATQGWRWRKVRNSGNAWSYCTWPHTRSASRYSRNWCWRRWDHRRSCESWRRISPLWRWSWRIRECSLPFFDPPSTQLRRTRRQMRRTWYRTRAQARCRCGTCWASKCRKIHTYPVTHQCTPKDCGLSIYHTYSKSWSNGVEITITRDRRCTWTYRVSEWMKVTWIPISQAYWSMCAHHPPRRCQPMRRYDDRKLYYYSKGTRQLERWDESKRRDYCAFQSWYLWCGDARRNEKKLWEKDMKKSLTYTICRGIYSHRWTQGSPHQANSRKSKRRSARMRKYRKKTTKNIWSQKTKRSKACACRKAKWWWFWREWRTNRRNCSYDRSPLCRLSKSHLRCHGKALSYQKSEGHGDDRYDRMKYGILCWWRRYSKPKCVDRRQEILTREYHIHERKRRVIEIIKKYWHNIMFL